MLRLVLRVAVLAVELLLLLGEAACRQLLCHLLLLSLHPLPRQLLRDVDATTTGLIHKSLDARTLDTIAQQAVSVAMPCFAIRWRGGAVADDAV